MKYYIDKSTQEVYAYEDDLDEVHIKEHLVRIDDAELALWQAAKEAAHIATLSYADKRRAEYPPMTDYLDGMVKGNQAQVDAYIAACNAVKAKYPKA